MPEQILSDNAKAFTSMLYRLLLGVLRVKVRYITPGCPWENPFAESFIGTLRAYFYPHMQRQQSVAGAQRVYTEKTDYYNHRVHWAFRKDKVKTPLGKLGKACGRSLPQDFELGVVATGKRFTRTVDGQGRISIKRYRLFVSVDLSKQKVEIREFFDSLVVIYRSGTVVSYPCSLEKSKITEVANAPIFHDHPGIEVSRQLELFDISEFLLRYVSRRPENQKRKRIEIDAIQLTFL